MIKTLITGASGFVGTNLISYFEREGLAEVQPLKLRNGWQGEIDQDVDAVIHLAGKAHDLKHTSDPAEYYQVNYQLTKSIYDAFLKSNATKFIFMSSVKAVTDVPEGILKEDFEPSPKTDYGKSKRLAEEYIEQNVQTGKHYYILRPCMIHGPGNKGNLNLLYNFVAKGVPYPLGAFKNERSFLSIENLSFVISELLKAEKVDCGVYNVADDTALSTNRIIELTAQSLERPARIISLPKGIVLGVAKVGDILKLPFNSHNLKKLTESFVVSNEKINNVITKRMPVQAENGILETLKAFKLRSN